MQKQSAIELSHKVAQSTSTFIDKYRFNGILEKKISTDSVCKVHFEIYIYIFGIFSGKNEFFLHTLIYIYIRFEAYMLHDRAFDTDS